MKSEKLLAVFLFIFTLIFMQQYRTLSSFDNFVSFTTKDCLVNPPVSRRTKYQQFKIIASASISKAVSKIPLLYERLFINNLFILNYRNLSFYLSFRFYPLRPVYLPQVFCHLLLEKYKAALLF